MNLLIVLLLNLTLQRPVLKVTPYEIAEKYLISPAKIKELNQKSIPDRVDLCDKLPEVASQNWQGSCVAWATGYYYKTFQEARERGWDVNNKKHICSPAFVYNQINSGNDDGSFVLDAFRLIRTSGCTSWYDMPYNPDDNTTLPTKEQQLNALKWRSDYFKFFYANTNNINSGKRVVPVSDEVLNAMKHHLANGDVFVISIPYYDDFGMVNSDFYTKSKDEITKQVGGHALVVCGYDDNAGNGRGGFRVKNSWGTDWGDRGLAYLSYEFMKYFSQEALFMKDRIDYQPRIYADIDLINVPRSQVSFMALGRKGVSPAIDYLRFDFRRDYHQIMDLTDLSVLNDNEYLFNFLDTYEDQNKALLTNLKILNYDTGEVVKDYSKYLPVELPDLGDIDILEEPYKSIHYDKNAYEDTTMGGKDNKEGYLGVEFYFKDEGLLKAIDFFVAHDDTEVEIYVYNDKEDFLNSKDSFIYNKNLSVKKKGWHTEWINDDILNVKKRDLKFVVLKYKNDKGNVIPIEVFPNEYAYSYYSLDGKTLEPLRYGAKIRVRQKVVDNMEEPYAKEDGCSFNKGVSGNNFFMLILFIFGMLLNRLFFLVRR